MSDKVDQLVFDHDRLLVVFSSGIFVYECVDMVIGRIIYSVTYVNIET